MENFSNIGKRMPYQVDGNFFAQNKANLLALASAQERRRRSLRRGVVGVMWLSVAAVLAVGLLLVLPQNKEHIEQNYSVENLSDEQLNALNNRLSSDLFLADL